MNEFITQATRVQQDGHGKIRTFSGLYVDPLNMRAEDIRIEDIAHHLANECRYAGACPHHYSVAQHSVLVALMFEHPEMKLAGLLHDAAEAYLKDIPSPVKHDPSMAWYRDVEHALTRLIYDKFGLPISLLKFTKVADDAVFNREVRSWWGDKVTIYPWTQEAAESMFLDLFNRLQFQLKLKGKISV